MDQNKSTYIDEKGNPKPNPFINEKGEVVDGKKPHWTAYIRMQRLFLRNASESEISIAWKRTESTLKHYEENF